VRVGAELSTTSPPLQERQLLAAIQTPHVAIIVFFTPPLKSTLTAFYALKHLCAGFEGNTLVGNRQRAVEPRLALAGWGLPNFLKDVGIRSDRRSHVGSETLGRISEFPLPLVLKLSPYQSISSLRSN
jgi:hypothetical protein